MWLVYIAELPTFVSLRAYSYTFAVHLLFHLYELGHIKKYNNCVELLPLPCSIDQISNSYNSLRFINSISMVEAFHWNLQFSFVGLPGASEAVSQWSGHCKKIRA